MMIEPFPKEWLKARRGIWRLRRAWCDLRIAILESRMQRLVYRMQCIDSDGCHLTLEEISHLEGYRD